MLVICNGAIKSGSTWLYNILRSLRSFEAPDESYLTLRNPRHPCIRPDRLREFLEHEDYVTRDFLSKNHFDRPEQKELLVSHENVYVLDIERDSRDVAVSHYYHERLRNGYQGSFSDFYWTVGRETVSRLGRYHAMWRDAGPRAFTCSYERLLQDFEAEVCKVAAFLSVSITVEEAQTLQAKTSLGALRKDYENEPRFEGEKFFRKGSIGDWKNHFTAEMLQDLQRIEDRGIGLLDVPRLRLRLSSVWRRS